MSMRAKGETLKGNARKFNREFTKVINGRRKEAPTTKEWHRSSAAQFAKSLWHQGVQKTSQIGPHHVQRFIAERSQVVDHGQLEKDLATIRDLAKQLNNKNMLPEKWQKKNPKEYKRTPAERQNPKTWKDPADRQKRQMDLEARSERYGLAARVSMELGTRKAESLATRWIIAKQTCVIDGKRTTQYVSNWGTKDPANDMKLVNIRDIRYMYATDEQRALRNTPKNHAFEKEHLHNMKDGQAYAFVPNAAKNGVLHLVPLQHQSQFNVIRKVNEFCMREKSKTLALKEREFEFSVNQFGRELRNVGIKKTECGYTLHVDRHEYAQRSDLSPEDLTKAMGHGDIRKIDAYVRRCK